MKRTTFAILGSVALGVAVIASGAAIAKQDGKGHHGERHAKMIDRMFEKMDTNKDGAIDASEIEAAKKARFTRMDSDGNGAISMEEMKAAAAKRAEEKAERRFSKLDANGDGAVDPAELEARKGHHCKDMMAHLDKNGDGKITREEAEAAKPHHRHHGKKGHEHMDDDHSKKD